MLKEYNKITKDDRVTCTGLYFSDEKALRKCIRWLKHTIRKHGYCLFTDVNWIDKLILVYYVAK